MKTGRPKETISLEDKFWSFVDKRGKDNCWNWKGTHFKQGYGRMYHHSIKEPKAHRLSYIINIGKIPNRLLVCHTCNNRSCVNPNHLYTGTNEDNMKDLADSGVLKGENNPASKLTKFNVIQIRRIHHKGTKNTRELAKMFNVSQLLISRIIRGVSWKHVGGPLFKGVKSKGRTSYLDVKKIRELYSNGLSIQELSVKFDKYNSTIYRIVFGQTHKSCPGPIAKKEIQ